MYRYANPQELQEAIAFWKRHRGLAPHEPRILAALGGLKKRPPRRRKDEHRVEVVLVPLSLDNRTILEEHFEEWARETWEIRAIGNPMISLERTTDDEGIFCTDNCERMAMLLETLEELNEEDLEFLASDNPS